MDVSVIFENNDFLVVNKPSGLMVHSAPNFSGPTLVSWLLKYYPKIKNVGESADRPGIVHRLDRDTSGVMIVAKNQEFFSFLKKSFQDRKISKTYLALVAGLIKEDKGLIDRPIGIFEAKRSVFAKNLKDVKEAITEFRVLKRFSGFGSNGASYLEVYPKTGRTNQIRVHLASLGHPVLGDPKYGSRQSIAGLGRMFLHAFRLEFSFPDGGIFRVEADLPEDLENFLKNLEK